RIAVKQIQRYLLTKGVGKRHIVFVGENTITKELQEIFERSGSVVVLSVAQNYLDLAAVYAQHPNVEEIIQTQDDHEQARHIINFCREHHLQYHFVPDLLEVHRSNIEITTVGGIPLICLKPTPLDGWQKVLKRIFDMAVSVLALVILSPIFLLVAMAIKLDSPGTVFFRFLDDGSWQSASGSDSIRSTVLNSAP
ncbi:MAG: sugar transferase, partial [Patescibacteria group bacterium]